MSEAISIRGTLTPDQQRSYVYVPFEVPSGVVKLHVTYTYSGAIGSDPQLTGGNTIDIGLFDARGTDFLGEGFRGWSGSARQSFFVATQTATPGYTPGPIQPGLWHICLGLYKISDDGCDYEINIVFETGETEPANYPSLLALSAEPHPAGRSRTGWYKGELHCHTVHSDGDSDPLAIIAQAEALGLDFLAITDHNVRTAQATLRDANTSLILIPGMEVTTYAGHWNIWGDGQWIDFRILSEDQMRQAIRAAKDRGYLTSCNHPRPFGPDWDYKAAENFDCVEIWNGPWGVFNDQAVAFWEQKLRAGQRYPAVGGSDMHFLKQEHIAKLGHPTTWVYCEGDPSARGLLDGIRAGHVFITASPEGRALYLTARGAMMGDHINPAPHDTLPITVDIHGGDGLMLELWGADGMLYQCPVDQDTQQINVDIDITSALYVRAQLTEGRSPDSEVMALTNPIFLIGNQ